MSHLRGKEVKERLAPLVGCKIVAAGEALYEGKPFPTLVVAKGKKRMWAVVMQDMEGNGPGHIVIC